MSAATPEPQAPVRKEWVKATHTPTGTTVTVSLVEGCWSGKATVKAYTTTIKFNIQEARGIAGRMIDAIKEEAGAE